MHMLIFMPHASVIVFPNVWASVPQCYAMREDIAHRHGSDGNRPDVSVEAFI